MLLEGGVAFLCKPSGITSASLLNRIKSCLKRPPGDSPSQGIMETPAGATLKVGHGGTLDKDACGILPFAIGRAYTPLLSNFLTNSTKEYHVVMKIGEATDSLDATGNIVRRMSHDELLAAKGRLTISALEGAGTPFWHSDYQQVPPMFSALKINGRRFSDVVRNNMQAEALHHSTFEASASAPAARLVKLYSLTFHQLLFPFIHFSLAVGSGFYVRAFVRDLSFRLGIEAHVHALFRSRHGPFVLDFCEYDPSWLLSGRFSKQLFVARDLVSADSLLDVEDFLERRLDKIQIALHTGVHVSRSFWPMSPR